MEARAESLQGSTSTTVNNMCLSLTWLDSLTIGGCELAPLCLFRFLTGGRRFVGKSSPSLLQAASSSSFAARPWDSAGRQRLV